MEFMFGYKKVKKYFSHAHDTDAGDCTGNKINDFKIFAMVHLHIPPFSIRLLYKSQAVISIEKSESDFWVFISLREFRLTIMLDRLPHKVPALRKSMAA